MEASKKNKNTWRGLAVLSVGFGVPAWFVGGLYASLIGVAAAVLGFLAVRKGQKIGQIGLYLGAFAALFVTLQDLGIVRRPANLESDKSHLFQSINASIRAHDVLKDSPLDEEEKEALIHAFKEALREANRVDVQKIEEEIPGFEDQYREHFIRAMTLLTEGFENNENAKSLEGAFLLERWARWNHENRGQLGKLKEPKPSIAAFVSAWIRG